MQNKIFSIIFSEILILVLIIITNLIIIEDHFLSTKTPFWFLSYFLAGFFLVFLCSFLLAKFLSYIVLKPLQTINFENLEAIPYKELKILLEKIKSKNKAVKTQFKYLRRKKQELQSLTQNMSD